VKLMKLRSVAALASSTIRIETCWWLQFQLWRTSSKRSSARPPLAPDLFAERELIRSESEDTVGLQARMMCLVCT
jgi:hypothetical protein